MHARKTTTVAIAIALATAALASCQGKAEKKTIFQFDRPDTSPREIVETDPPLRGRDATYSVPARRQLLTVEPSYTSYSNVGFDPIYGPYESSGQVYHEEIYPSDYFLERTGEPILPDGAHGLYFDLRLSHSQVPEEGGTVWARVQLAAPSFVPRSETGLNLALVVDLSESMRSPEKQQLLRRVAKNLISQLLPEDRVAIVGFGDGVHVLRPSGELTDRAEVLDRLDRLVATGGDDLGGGIYEGYLQARDGFEKGGGPGHVILISDGILENGGGWRVEELARQRHAQGFRLSTIGIGEELDAGLLVSMARAGEGRFAYVPAADRVDDVLSREMRSVLRSYARDLRLVVESPGIRVLAAYGPGILNPGFGARQLALSDFGPGEERSLLLRLKIPALGAEGFQRIQFKLYYTQSQPVRRTTREASVKVQAGSTLGGEDRLVEIQAKLAMGLDMIRRALEEPDSLSFARAVIDMLEREFPAWKATVFSEGDRGLMRLAALFEEFAGRLRGLQEEGRLGRRTPERERLRSEFYYRHG